MTEADDAPPAGPVRWIRRGSPAELAPLPPESWSVIVDGDLEPDAWRRVADLLRDRPEVELSIQHGADLEMLRWFPEQARLHVGSLRLRSLEGIGHVHGALERLTLGDTLKPVSMAPLAGAPRLTRLGINGSWRHRDETLSTLVGMERLGVGTVQVESLLSMTRLRRFTSGLGTIHGLERLPDVGALELVELYRLRGPHDLAPLARIPSLRYLVLSSTSAVTALPSFADSLDLRWIALDTMAGVTDLRPIADAPNLEVLLLIGMPLPVEALRPLVGHPTLKAGIWGLGSMRRNAEAQALLPLPPGPAESVPWTKRGWTGIRHPTET